MAYRDNLKKEQEFKMEEQSTANAESAVSADTPTEQSEETPKQNTSIRGNVKRAVKHQNRNKAKRENGIVTWFKMWISVLVSMIMKDRGKIPDDIGDKILISNNLYITKLYMSTIIQIQELGIWTPETFVGVLNIYLRDKGNKAVLDLTLKNRKYEYDPKKSGLQSRINMWTNTAENPEAHKKMRERANRCLYTVQKAESGVQLKETRWFLTIRAKDIQTLNNAERIVTSTLTSMGCTWLPAYGTIRQRLEYISILGNRTDDYKTIIPVMTSNQVLAQSAPNCGSFNDKQGTYLGMNVLSGQPFYIDFESITSARNMYVVAPSGVGKTVLAVNMAQSAFENGAACCFMDIKGNEYTSFIKATGGYTVSLRPQSIEYINSWIMHKNDTTDANAEAYFKSRINFCKQQMLILSGIRDREQLVQFEELLDEFHDSLYISLGVIAGNRNSWRATENLNPYVVFEKFETYLTPKKRAEYSFPKTVIGTLRMYMSATGSKSYVFKKEFDYARIIDSPTLSFDFGILGSSTISDIDLDLFRLKFLYMSKLNGEFVTRKYSQGLRTFKVLEESQIVSDEIMEMYSQEYTLRRSQRQDTVLLGNSVQALSHNKFAQSLIENTRGLFVGELTLDARRTLIEQFGLQHLQDLIMLPGSKKQFKNCFLFVNNMQKKSLYPIIKVVMNEEVWGPYPKKMYKILTPVKEGNVMAGTSGE